jgi:hypothetical protein
MMQQIRDASPRSKARIAGALYVFAVLGGVLGEAIGGKLSIATGLIAVVLYAAVTLLIYDIFKPVDRKACLLAVCTNLVGLALEALRWNFHGVDIAMVFHGFYCLMIGLLIFRSTFLPRALGALMVPAGLGWLTFLWPQLVIQLSPYLLLPGLVGEGTPMLWLLVMGVDLQQWREQAGVEATP